jgi:hypothetical protein
LFDSKAEYDFHYGEQWIFIPKYLALKEMILSRRSMGHITDLLDNICGTIERIQKAVMESYDGDTNWQGKVPEILAPLQIVDTLQIVAY